MYIHTLDSRDVASALCGNGVQLLPHYPSSVSNLCSTPAGKRCSNTEYCTNTCAVAVIMQGLLPEICLCPISNQICGGAAAAPPPPNSSPQAPPPPATSSPAPRPTPTSTPTQIQTQAPTNSPTPAPSPSPSNSTPASQPTPGSTSSAQPPADSPSPSNSGSGSGSGSGSNSGSGSGSGSGSESEGQAGSSPAASPTNTDSGNPGNQNPGSQNPGDQSPSSNTATGGADSSPQGTGVTGKKGGSGTIVNAGTLGVGHIGSFTIGYTSVSEYETTRTISGSVVVATIRSTSTGVEVIPSGATYTLPDGSVATAAAGAGVNAGTPDTPQAVSHHKSNIGAIIGGLLAALILLAIIFALCVYRNRLRRKRTTAASAHFIKFQSPAIVVTDPNGSHDYDATGRPMSYATIEDDDPFARGPMGEILPPYTAGGGDGHTALLDEKEKDGPPSDIYGGYGVGFGHTQ